MGRWQEMVKRSQDHQTKLTKPTKPPLHMPKSEVLSVLSVLSAPFDTDFEERAAIVEYDANVPREWAEGYARLLCLRPPEGIAPERWQQVVSDGGYFIDRWAEQASILGWSTQEVFGVSPTAPEHRLDRRGLVLALEGREITLLTEEAATINPGPGRPLRIGRRIDEGAVPLWQAGRKND